MPVPEKQKKYNSTHIKRVPLDMQKSYYDEVLKPAADSQGCPVNRFIKNAISEKISRDCPQFQKDSPSEECPDE